MVPIPAVEPAATEVVTIPRSVLTVDLTFAQDAASVLDPVAGSAGIVLSTIVKLLVSAEDIPTAASVNAWLDSTSSPRSPFPRGAPLSK